VESARLALQNSGCLGQHLSNLDLGVVLDLFGPSPTLGLGDYCQLLNQRLGRANDSDADSRDVHAEASSCLSMSVFNSAAILSR